MSLSRTALLLLLRLLSLAAALACSCSAPRQETLPDGPLVDGEGPGLDPYVPRYPGEDRGTLERAEVDEVLLAGPQAFIGKIRVTPAMLADKFVGFRLEELFPDDVRFRKVDLHAGDILLRINGQPIERPDDFLKIWEQLKVAQELRIEYLRGAMVRLLSWKIVDSRALPQTLVP